MIEIPESRALARELADTLTGKTIWAVRAGASPHKFAWYFGDPARYPDLLVGLQIDGAQAWGGQVEIQAGEARLLFSDGVNMRYCTPDEKPPQKHQLQITFGDRSTLTCSVQMYGGLSTFRDGKNDNPYYLISKQKPSPLSAEFGEAYFASLMDERTMTLSAKAFLATEQRIPGLGNGVLQDMLFRARVNPRRKMSTLSDAELGTLYAAVKSALFDMTQAGGRDTERGLRGQPGGYRTIMSKNGLSAPCPGCGGEIRKEAYLGGSVYYCPNCQKT